MARNKEDALSDAITATAQVSAAMDGLDELREYRNERIRDAYAAGVSKSELSRKLGFTRPTIDRILDGGAS